MPYTLKRTWKSSAADGTRDCADAFPGGETFAEAERRARTLWSGAAWKAGTVPASTVVSIVDASERTVASVLDSGDNAPALAMAGEEDPAVVRWRRHLRESGLLAEGVRRSLGRLSGMGTGDLAGEEGAEALDACTARVVALVYRIDEMMHRGLKSLGGDPDERKALRDCVEGTLEAAGLDAYLEEAFDGRIQVVPSTLPPEALAGRVEALVALAGGLLRAQDAIEAHALGTEPDAPAPGL